jgi:hypothetical protein
MMNLRSLSRRPTDFESLHWVRSKEVADVRFAVREPSLGRRIELTRRLHELTIRNEFLASGRELQQLEITLAELLVQKLLVEWGLAAIEGLTIDGTAATAESLIEAGPEKLIAEIAAAVKQRCGLSEEERKNS